MHNDNRPIRINHGNAQNATTVMIEYLNFFTKIDTFRNAEAILSILV